MSGKQSPPSSSVYRKHSSRMKRLFVVLLLSGAMTTFLFYSTYDGSVRKTVSDSVRNSNVLLHGSGKIFNKSDTRGEFFVGTPTSLSTLSLIHI